MPEEQHLMKLLTENAGGHMNGITRMELKRHARSLTQYNLHNNDDILTVREVK